MTPPPSALLPGAAGTAHTRRAVVTTGAAVVAGAALAVVPTAAEAATTGFLHGVASGDPAPDGLVIWTRVTPTTASRPGSGSGPRVPVRWEVAADAAFRMVIRSGWVTAGPERDHTVKVAVTGLAPATRYWYRFRLGTVTSRAGRARTAARSGAAVARLRLGVVSCSNWQAGYFSAYRLLATQDLDAVLHMGDYLYEYAPGEYQARDQVVRPHDPAVEMTTLAHYRRRHAQYKTDPDLQALHASAPFVVTWDDHEFTNDAWSGGAENHTPGVEGDWTTRRRYAQQAYAEWMPVRYTPGSPLYRRIGFGSLASVSMLDLRTYRSEQVDSPADPAIDDASRTITGKPQMDWLLQGLSSTAVQWKLVGNPVMITPIRFPSTLSLQEREAVSEMVGTQGVDGLPYNVDQWDGYAADQDRVIRHLTDRGIRDTVFLTGDIHSGWACDIPVDPTTYPVTGRSAANELVCTSVTSDNLDDITMTPPRTSSLAVETAFKASNPYVKYLDFDSHGYSVLEVTPAAVRMDWYRLADRTSRTSASTRTASWQIDAGTARVRRIGTEIL